MFDLHSGTVAIVDYKAGNLFSVEHACRAAGLKPNISCNYDDILSADGLILPGVGAFGESMDNLRKLDLVGALHDFAASGRPFLGICLGMQLLFTTSVEFGEHAGLGLVDGLVLRLPGTAADGSRSKVPQIGWNRIRQVPTHVNTSWVGSPLADIADGEFMYFVHSYFVQPSSTENILATTEYNGHVYCSAVRKGNICAVQFHPEKSGQEGIKIYRRFADAILNEGVQ